MILPAHVFMDETYGIFRMCITAQTEATTRDALERIANVLVAL